MGRRAMNNIQNPVCRCCKDRFLHSQTQNSKLQLVPWVVLTVDDDGASRAFALRGDIFATPPAIAELVVTDKPKVASLPKLQGRLECTFT